MERTRSVQANAVGLSLAVLALVLLASSAWAQQSSAIAGLVRDASGGVLPGVTVEAASPALIEKVRVVYTDDQGRYNIVDLRPGTYTVTFTLPGFSVIRREGIQLPVGFTATVNADMQVGALEETVTVTGETPLVDTSNVRQQTLVSDELRAALPSGAQGLMSIAALIPGMTNALDQGGGGALGIYGSNQSTSAAFHGKGSTIDSYDGMQVNNLSGIGSVSYIMNPATVEETAVQTGGISAESNAGFSINMVPKTGGNEFRGSFDGTYTNQDLQGSNLSDNLRARGVRGEGQKTLRAYDTHVTVGGPIRRDRVWFFAATRFMGTKNQPPDRFFNKTQGTPFYTPDLDRPHFNQDWLRSQAVRITAQVSQKNRVNGFADPQYFQTRGWQDIAAPEAQTCWSMWPQGLYQGTWTSTLTSRLLLEAGASLTKGPFPCTREQTTDIFGFSVKPTDVSILEQTRGYRYNAKASYLYRNDNDRFHERFAVSYVTGSHTFKAGAEVQQHVNDRDTLVNSDLLYTFRNGVPTQLTMRATPTLEKNRTKADLGVYAQDQWAIKRLTLNYGLRFDYFNGYVAAQRAPAGQYVGERNFARVDGVPEWTDLNPRVGVSYDLFGTGRTALKASFSRYVGKEAVSVAQANNPMLTSVNSANRAWNDANRNYIPDCDLLNFEPNGECGPISNVNFGQINPNALRFADDVIGGFGKRDYLWDSAAEVQHQIGPGISMMAGYYRNWSDHFRALPRGDFTTVYVVDNLAVTPADYQHYCITAPLDPRLPGGGGYPVCGLYDIVPEKFGQGTELAARASSYGKGKYRTADFLTASLNARIGTGIELGASVDTGRTVEDNCFVVDSPGVVITGNILGPNTETTVNGKPICRVTAPFKGQTQVKVHGVFPLPGGFVVSGVFQNLSGFAYEANYSARNDEIVPSLGRNLAACGTRAVCTASVLVPLVVPQTQFEPRRNLVDLRLSKVFSVGPKVRLRANLDVYNVLNDSAVLVTNNNYGTDWLRPANRGIVAPRSLQLGGRLTF
jgi:hypothetical protein